ncbi:amino acid permease/ SLC12A domain-containing protein [Collybia nuda]|uniref:Amino acid permease/ SLC12A domain-containing protein n=1 Tax=Collybia nuda TaxID=64659 RepID=A0A9P6CI92_9AGAR|nr:amino acid permease/ SLC12A domain-containing protein [Collybia nuda]
MSSEEKVYDPESSPKHEFKDIAHDAYIVDASTTDPHMHRSLKGRHVSMIAIAGTIGTGLFLGSGKAIANGGPVGAVLGYLIVGCLVGFMMYSLGEMMVYDPSACGFIEFSARYVDPALGFAMGWQYWFQTAMTAAVEIVAASIVIEFWDANSKHLAIYVTVMLVGIIIINIAGVKYFGEFEFWFAFLKIITVLGLCIVCLVVDLGGAPDRDRRGFRYWRDSPFNNSFLNITPPSKARFLGFWNVFTQAAFSYGGMEGLASICLEAENPQKTMRTATRAIFYRIVLLYIVSLWLAGMCIAPDNPNLLRANAEDSGTAAESPFVIVITTAGIKVLDHIINAVVLTSAFSAGNEALYASSRALFMLAQEGKAPRFFAKVLRSGVPINALLFTALFGCLAYLNCGAAGAGVAFNWLANITTLGSMLTWCGVALSHIRFSRGMRAQGVSRDILPFRSFLLPWGSYVVLISFIIIIFFSGWTALKPWSPSDFFSVYVNIPFAFILFVGYKVIMKTKLVPLNEMDLSSHYVKNSVVRSKF